jgi:hypothetical protein
MAAGQKFNQFVADMGLGVHNFPAHSLMVMLSNSAPAPGNAVKADITEIASGNGYVAGGNAAAFQSWGQTGGLAKLVLADPSIWTAAGGSIGPLRYATLYNNTPTSPAKPLICFWDYGSSITLASGETFTVDLDATNGVLTLQ